MHKRKPVRTSLYLKLLYVFIALTIVTTLSMVVPFWTALSAGIASLSVVIFGITSLVLFVVLFIAPRPLTGIIVVSLSVSLFGLIAPQLVFLQAASKINVPLSFKPLSYLHFSGKSELPADKTVVYKQVSGQKLRLAFYSAHKNQPAPVVVLLHGGGWRYGNYLETGLWPRFLTENGFNVVSVEYRLSSDSYHSWKDAPSDVHDAILYIKSQASAFNIDASQVNLLGQSAGGHLALLEAYRAGEVRSVVALYAPIDLTLDYQTSRDKSAELDFIGGPPSQYPDRYKLLSPLSYVSASSPPTLLVQGLYDDLVVKENSVRLGQELSRQGVRYQTLFLPFTGHSFENQRGGFATQITTWQVIKFLK